MSLTHLCLEIVLRRNDGHLLVRGRSGLKTVGRQHHVDDGAIIVIDQVSPDLVAAVPRKGPGRADILRQVLGIALPIDRRGTIDYSREQALATGAFSVTAPVLQTARSAD